MKIYSPIEISTEWKYEYPEASGSYVDLNTLLTHVTYNPLDLLDIDIINLPNDVITSPITITKSCRLQGQGTNSFNRTTFDVSNVRDIDGNLVIVPKVISIVGYHVHLDNINISNSITDQSFIGLYIENGSVDLSECAISAGKAVYFKSCTSSSIDSISVSGGKLGMLFEDSYNIAMSNSEVYSADNCVLFQGSSSVIGDRIYPPATVAVKENVRPDRTHDITITNSNFYKSQIAILHVNADHISFSSCKIYDVTNTAIMQMNNSYSNTYKQGEFYNIASFAVKNSDNQGGVHIIDATECWWGDPMGPSGMGKGTGAKISKDVTFSPWARVGTEPMLTYPGLRKFVWGMLGAPQVKVELTEEDVTECINMAIDRYLYYLTPDLDYHYFSGPNYGAQEYLLPVEIPKKAIYEVIYQPNSDIFTNLSGSGESFLLTYYMQNSGGTFLSDFYVAMSYKETMERTLGIQPSYEFLSRPYPGPNDMMRDFIRIYPKSTSSVRLAIKYSRMLSEYETDAAIWIKKYALAWAKEKLGRVRSKYASVPGPTGDMSLDGGTLLQESATEKEALILELISWSEPLSFSTY